MTANSVHTLFYDSTCNLCSRSVRLLKKWDNKNELCFESQNSIIYKEICQKNKGIEETDSILLVVNGKYYLKSEAIFRSLIHINKFKLAVKIISKAPLAMNDFFYDCIAKIRHLFINKNCKI